MNKFNLKEALAGAKVITRDGREVTQLTCFSDVDDHNPMIVYGVVSGDVDSWTAGGFYHSAEVEKCEGNLIMAPKKLSGFININNNDRCVWTTGPFKTKSAAKGSSGNNRIACIDLSQFDEGHGL